MISTVRTVVAIAFVCIVVAPRLCIESCLGQEPVNRQVRVILSSEDGVHKLSEADPIRFSKGPRTSDLLIEVMPDQPRQEILGLGASLDHATCENLSKLSAENREAVVRKLVDPKLGIGMNLMRICIGTSDFVGEPYYSYDDLPEDETDPELTHFSIERDRKYVLPVLKLAQKKNADILFFASPWSPPGWMKTSGQLGTGSVKPEFYPAYAQYLLKFIRAYEAEGIPIHAITVQNEPQHEDARYPTTIWAAEDQRDFIRDHLGPLFEQEKIKTLIWCWDHNWNKMEFPRTILLDPVAARYVDGTAFHHYEGAVEAQLTLQKEFPEKHMYFTEGSVFRTDGAMRLIDILRHGSRSYNAWVIMLDEQRKPNRGPHSASATCIELLPDRSVRYNYDYFMQGQFMKFISRGAARIESSSPQSAGFSHVAFLDSSGQIALIVANASRFPKKFQVRSGGDGFETELPPNAVGTFLWSRHR